MEEAHNRSFTARVGIAALNLLAPGLGLLRLGSGVLGLKLLAAPAALLAASAGLFAVAPTPTFAGAVIFALLLAGLLVGIMALSIALTWRRSRIRSVSRPWWARWYGLVLAGIVAAIASNVAVLACHSFYKPFYTPAEGMVPTLAAGDKFLADMRGGRQPARGDIVLIDTPHGIYVKRVAALPGDRLAMQGGVPIINGKPAFHRPEGVTAYDGIDGRISAQLFSEQLPGEAAPHQILDAGRTMFDDTGEVIVPSGHIFVLGDNRDNSADSRVPVEQYGVGMVAFDRIVGQALFVYWSDDSEKIGRLLIR